MNVRQCTQCSEVLPLAFFYKDKSGKEGHRANCKSCSDENRKKYPQTRNDRLRNWDRNRYQNGRKQDPRHRASILNCGARKRSTERDLEYDLDIDWVHEKLLKGVCEVSGIPFKFDYEYTPGGYGVGRAFAPSLDRVDPMKGYTKDNVKVVVWCYNACKGVASHNEVLILAKALVAANDN